MVQGLGQGCQMVYFQTSYGTFWKPLNGNFGYLLGMTIWYKYFVAICFKLCQFDIFCGHFFYPPPYWYIASRKIWQPWH
jgi:hypothetical protein